MRTLGIEGAPCSDPSCRCTVLEYSSTVLPGGETKVFVVAQSHTLSVSSGIGSPKPGKRNKDQMKLNYNIHQKLR